MAKLVDCSPCTHKAVGSNPQNRLPALRRGSVRIGVLGHPEIHETLNQKGHREMEEMRGDGRNGRDEGR